MALVEPVPGEPAAVADLPDERVLLIADYHAGIEAGLRYERGVELDSDADGRREHVLSLLDRTTADRLVVLGDLAHRIPEPEGPEREEIEALIAAVTERVPMTLVVGNHDAGVAESVAERVADGLTVIPPEGGRLGAEGRTRGKSIGVVHGHTWPEPDVLEADVVCLGHEHPQVRLSDAVGGSRVEHAWLRGSLRVEAFDAAEPGSTAVEAVESDPDVVVFPAFNERSGGTWVNVEGNGFLSPFLPDALDDAEAYLLDGTRLGPYRDV
ncbi:metallophosphoesterase [Halopenitus sp. POP-27]|uniref:metallophosphoesterase n=1 Tax=Halopenitus sp. POP-27 TaxID=2994425 RepID=UPI002469127E|nr:metallophosphoesterase [Halopenitus sp. POP-27]